MRLVVAGLAVFGLVTLFSSAAGAAVGIGALLLVPLFIIMKIAFFMLLFGFIARGFANRGYQRRGRSWMSDWTDDWENEWSDWRARRQRPSGSRARWERRRRTEPSEGDRFEEWHRMAHAKKEVDSWVDPQIEE